MRVFLSSLRCFFFAIRFRRFFITEPTGNALLHKNRIRPSKCEGYRLGRLLPASGGEPGQRYPAHITDRQ